MYQCAVVPVDLDWQPPDLANTAGWWYVGHKEWSYQVENHLLRESFMSPLPRLRNKDSLFNQI